jgi:endogenous inhibitor of DNA gyrase (YacG/DUF329 family)
MSDLKLTVSCDYCGTAYGVLYAAGTEAPTFCPFCSEFVAGVSEIPDEEDEDDDKNEDDRNTDRY